jgi:hypothetical protein
MNRAYSCDYQPDRKEKKPISVKIVTEDSSNGIWFSEKDEYHDVEKGIFSLRLGGGSSKATIWVQGECLAAIMKAIATGLSPFSIETTISNEKEPMCWSFKGLGMTHSQPRALKYYTYQLNNSLKVANKNLKYVTIQSKECALQQNNVRASLQVPSILNPFGSLSIKIEDGKVKVLAIDIVLARSLIDFSMLTDKITPQNNNFEISYTENDAASEETVFLDRAEMEQLQSYCSKLQWRNRGLLGFSLAAFVALLAYFKLNQK